jgi:hypothetical protein
VVLVRGYFIRGTQGNIERSLTENNRIEKTENMDDHFKRKAELANTEGGYICPNRGISFSEAFPLPREGAQDDEGLAGGEPPSTEMNSQVLQGLGIVRGCCAMKPTERAEEDGKGAPAHSRAVPVFANGMPAREKYSSGSGKLGCKWLLCL